MSKKKTVLVVVAHADDMEFLAGGTVARFVDEMGYDVYEYILTDNSKGSYRLPVEELVADSAKEAVVAGEVLGLRDVRLDTYEDACLNEENPNVLRDKVMAMCREVQADVVMSWDPYAPYEDHPDHRAVGMATFEAASFAGNPMFHPEHEHPPYPVTEAYWIAKWPLNAELFVDISATIDKKIEALLKHETQMWLTVDALAQEAKAIGVDLPGLADLDATGFAPMMDDAMRKFCAEVGAKAGYAFAEQFRYQRFGMLGRLLGEDIYESDF
ncbi:MAG: PIG-L family deacetylase [bacterium]|nr:PIG-L family deacetylase [bacterium]